MGNCARGRIGHGAVALDIADDLPVILANLQALPAARIINVSDFLPMRVHDVGARRGRGRRCAIVLKFEAPRIRGCGGAGVLQRSADDAFYALVHAS